MENHGIVHIGRSAAEAFTALVLFAAIAILFAHSFSLPPSPMRGYPGAAFMPRLILIYTGVFTLLWLLRLLLGRLAARRETERSGIPITGETFEFEYLGYFTTIVIVLAFVFGLEYLGFEITCFALLSLMLASRLSSVALAVAVAAMTTLFIYTVFVLVLNVSVPLALLPNFIAF